MKITKDITIEELTAKIPAAVAYLREQGIRCIICGEPIWGTLESAAKEKGFNTEQIQIFIDELNKIIANNNESNNIIQHHIDVKKIQ